jgi:uncharacterized protein (DUF885 family)
MTAPMKPPAPQIHGGGISLAHKVPPPSGDYHWVYLWEWPIRAMHWLAAGSLVALVVTGLYIGMPYFVTTGDTSAHFLMGWMRAVHFGGKYTEQMYAKLPTMFGRMPKAKLEVMPIEEFREKEASTEYVLPAQDGSRPAHIMVNTGDFEKRTLLSVETTTYHEGVPGHHMQIAIAQELTELPPFRQNEFFTSYTEGWALYSERLGKEFGFYQDPYSYYGHLQDDMLRAIRLVVDTGLHYKHWSRQQVVDFFHAHSAIDEPEVQSETDRYIAWPGQALGYKIGQLEILKLRQYAKDELGDRFSLAAFHDEILGAGALPLDILSSRIHSWVASQKPAGISGGSGQSN